jgi:hypothetical protein
MQAIEFEATTFQHTIRIPDTIPDGVSLRVLLLVDEAKTNFDSHWKNLLGTMPNVGNDTDFARESNAKRQAALAHIAAMKVNWQGKPIENRDALYDNARD